MTAASTRRVLVVDDEPAVVDVVEFALHRAGFAVERARNLDGARRWLVAGAVDLVVLDVGLPDGDGIDFCRELRARGSKMPVLILTCREDEVDRVLGLESGADDYVTKPFSPRELVARVKTILRRARGPAGGPAGPLRVELGRMVVDREQHRALLGPTQVTLTPKEFELLAALCDSPDRVWSRGDLLARLYGDGAFVGDRTVDSFVKGIRRKFGAVEPGADPIETVYGVGYRIRPLP